MDQLAWIVQIFVQILIFAIVGRSLLTWFPIDQRGPIFEIINAITDPILVPLRRVIPLVGMIDITPMVAIFLLYAIQSVLAGR